MGRLLITGDTHGEQARLVYLARWMQENDTLMVAGDFGFIFRNDKPEHVFLDEVETLLDKKQAYLVFVDGNHENHIALAAYPVTVWNGAKVHQIKPRIIHVLRGEVVEIKGKKIFCFGGAFSVDRIFRQLNVSYWDEKLPNEAEYENGRKNLQGLSYQVDYIVTHTCPLKTMGMLNNNRPGFVLGQPLANYLEWVCETVQYQKWYFGHWHVDRQLWKEQRAIYYDVVDMETGEQIVNVC